MVFGNKNKGNKSAGGHHVLRGRDSFEHKTDPSAANNPLARRIHADDEPDTIDLQEPGRFHTVVESEEPETSSFTDPVEGRKGLVCRDEKTGKFYVYPGTEAQQVSLAGEAVLTPTELRRGDIIRIGDAQFQFLPKP